MRPSTQDKFRRRVKTWLLHRNETVTALARRIGRNRCNVSSAINSGHNRRIRAEIEKLLT